jgi:hypothetical protein
VEDLRRKQTAHEHEVAHVEESYKVTAEEIEQDLVASRERVLQLIDEKSALETELDKTRGERKEL